MSKSTHVQAMLSMTAIVVGKNSYLNSAASGISSAVCESDRPPSRLLFWARTSMAAARAAVQTEMGIKTRFLLVYGFQPWLQAGGVLVGQARTKRTGTKAH